MNTPLILNSEAAFKTFFTTYIDCLLDKGRPKAT